MGFRDWLVRRLGGDALVGDPDGIVEVALVQLAQSELMVAALRSEGITARAVHDHSAVGTLEQLRPMARIFARRADARRALEVIGHVQKGGRGGDVDWPPPPDAGPWQPPATDGALP